MSPDDSTVRVPNKFRCGEKGSINSGPLKGLNAIVMREADGDTLLLRIADGVYVRLDNLFVDLSATE